MISLMISSISGTICNFDIEAIGIDIVISILRYRRTPILKKRQYRRFVIRYRRIPISKKRRYRRLYCDIGMCRYRRFFDINVQNIYRYRSFILRYRRCFDIVQCDIDVSIDSSGPGSTDRQCRLHPGPGYRMRRIDFIAHQLIHGPAPLQPQPRRLRLQAARPRRVI
jgi:hypothetical protein